MDERSLEPQTSNGSSPQVTLYAPIEARHKCYLFKQPGYVINGEQRFKMGNYTWCILPYMYERYGKWGIDLILTVQGIEPGHYLLAEFAFQQPGGEKQQFEHAFDYTRNSFFYRRALTIPDKIEENGVSSANYSYYRFLRSRETDEPQSAEESLNWKTTVPLDWGEDGEHPVVYNHNDTFLNNIYLLEEGKMTFMYFFTVESAQKMNYAPNRDIIVWPKASKTAHYLDRKSISVDECWFNRWPGFKKFMQNADLLHSEDYDDLVDILGVYYHSWNLDHHRLQELVRQAEKFGFFDFPQSQLLVGNVDVYFSSMRSVLFAPLSHPLVKINHPPNFTDRINVKGSHTENFSFSLKNIWLDELFGPPVYKCFKTKNGMSWTVNLHRKTFCDKEYLSVSLLLNGPFRPDENQLWKVEFLPEKHSSIGKLPKREHQRVLNTVQRTICFPTCWLWADVMKEMGANGPYSFTLKTQFNSMSGWRWYDVSGAVAATGVMNAQLQCGKVIHAINFEYINEFCGKIKSNWVEVEGKPKRMVLDLDEKDVLHFLDHLYHGSKFYTADKWQKILKVAQATDCFPVVDQFERALVRTEARKVTDKTFSENYSLDYLRFNVEMGEQFGLETLDDFLNSHPEPVINTFDNDGVHLN